MRALKHIEQLVRIRAIVTEEGEFIFRGVDISEGVAYVVCEDYNGATRKYPADELTEKCFEE